MLLDCDKREVGTFRCLSDALDRADEVGRCLWVQVNGRPASLYKAYPGGRVVMYTITQPWTKGRPQVETTL